MCWKRLIFIADSRAIPRHAVLQANLSGDFAPYLTIISLVTVWVFAAVVCSGLNQPEVAESDGVRFYLGLSVIVNKQCRDSDRTPYIWMRSLLPRKLWNIATTFTSNIESPIWVGGWSQSCCCCCFSSSFACCCCCCWIYLLLLLVSLLFVLFCGGVITKLHG